MTSKKSILFVGEAVSLAHVSRPLALAQALDAQQYDIHFACDSRYQFLFEGLPHIRYWPLKCIPADRFVRLVDKGERIWSPTDIDSYVGQELALYAKVCPFLIVQDFRVSVPISAELMKVPHATLANAHWSPYRDLPFEQIPWPPERPPPKSNALDALAAWRDKISAKFWNPKNTDELHSVNHVRMKHGLAPLSDFLEMFTRGDYTLYSEPPGYIPTKPLPSHHSFLGPVLWSPTVPKPTWWETWDPKLPIIYLTLGSTGVVKLLPKILRTLQELPATIVVTTSGRISLEDMPKNVFAAEYLPGLEICKLASLVVCNGGSATSYQALSQGTPTVGIWSNLDQYMTMMLIEHAGAGICYAASTYQAQTLQSAISTVLHGANYRAKAEELRGVFGSYDASHHFREFVRRVTENLTSQSP